MEYKIIVNSPEETYEIGKRIASAIRAGDIVMLNGPLGAGKTVMTKGICEALGFNGDVYSPTYTLMNIYEGGNMPIYHYDAYRLSSMDDLYDIGFWDNADEGVSIVEWAVNVFEKQPKNTFLVEFERRDLESLTLRNIIIKTPEDREVSI